MIQQDFFWITKLEHEVSGPYYKITDRATKRFCYATPRMLNEVVDVLVKCIKDGKYILKNNFTIDYKVWKIFLDAKEADRRFKEYRAKYNIRKLKHEIKTKIEWQLINYYLSKRNFNLMFK